MPHEDFIKAHDDVIKWKHFQRYWSFVPEIHWSIPLTKASYAEFWCFSLIFGDLRRHRVHYEVTVFTDDVSRCIWQSRFNTFGRVMVEITRNILFVILVSFKAIVSSFLVKMCQQTGLAMKRLIEIPKTTYSNETRWLSSKSTGNGLAFHSMC